MTIERYVFKHMKPTMHLLKNLNNFIYYIFNIALSFKDNICINNTFFEMQAHFESQLQKNRVLFKKTCPNPFTLNCESIYFSIVQHVLKWFVFQGRYINELSFERHFIFIYSTNQTQLKCYLPYIFKMKYC